MSSPREGTMAYHGHSMPFDMSKIMVSYCLPVKGDQRNTNYVRIVSGILNKSKNPSSSVNSEDYGLEPRNTTDYSVETTNTTDIVRTCGTCERTENSSKPPHIKPFPLQMLSGRAHMTSGRKLIIDSSNEATKPRQRKGFWRSMSLTSGELNLYNSFLSNSTNICHSKGNKPLVGNDRLEDFIHHQHKADIAKEPKCIFHERRSTSSKEQNRMQHNLHVLHNREHKSSQGRLEYSSHVIPPPTLILPTKDMRLKSTRWKNIPQQHTTTHWCSAFQHSPQLRINLTRSAGSSRSNSFTSAASVNPTNRLPIMKKNLIKINSRKQNLPTMLDVKNNTTRMERSVHSEGDFLSVSSTYESNKSRVAPPNMMKLKQMYSTDNSNGYVSYESDISMDDKSHNQYRRQGRSKTIAHREEPHRMCVTCKHKDLQTVAIQLSPRPPMNSPELDTKDFPGSDSEGSEFEENELLTMKRRLSITLPRMDLIDNT